MARARGAERGAVPISPAPGPRAPGRPAGLRPPLRRRAARAAEACPAPHPPQLMSSRCRAWALCGSGPAAAARSGAGGAGAPGRSARGRRGGGGGGGFLRSPGLGYIYWTSAPPGSPELGANLRSRPRAPAGEPAPAPVLSAHAGPAPAAAAERPLRPDAARPPLWGCGRGHSDRLTRGYPPLRHPAPGGAGRRGGAPRRGGVGAGSRRSPRARGALIGLSRSLGSCNSAPSHPPAPVPRLRDLYSLQRGPAPEIPCTLFRPGHPLALLLGADKVYFASAEGQLNSTEQVKEGQLPVSGRRSAAASGHLPPSATSTTKPPFLSPLQNECFLRAMRGGHTGGTGDRHTPYNRGQSGLGEDVGLPDRLKRD
ncbi:translation initiation factor IF-2-like [Elephas maximus indicus]|uniref:translation initiation factor IF-2-like n=1 Tax=Elephas maximus indicus TaxID=99487 RepID=UPI002117299D|nr:translation initiation factor IF-2-like [Elephas maximus indicus]